MNRAAEIQAERVTEAPALSMGGIKRIGAEVDIPPEDVEAAARAVAAPSPAEGPIAPWHRVFGGSMAIRLERVVDGELLESEFPVIVEEVQTTLGNVGHASTLGRSLAWRTSSSGTGEGRAVHLQVMPRRGVTRIVLEERVGGLAGGLFGGIVGGGGMGGAIPITAVGITALELAAGGVLLGAGVWLAGSYVLARTLFRTVRRGRRAELEGLMDRLADFAVENAVRGAPLPPGDGPAGRLP